MRGRVVLATPDLDVPVRRARVSLINETGASPPDAYTDANGRFVFTDVAAGRYLASAWKTGYVEMKFGARSYWDRPVSLVVPPGGALNGVDIRLSKGAAISGRIVDALGEPIPDVTVSAVRVATNDGRIEVVNAAAPAADGARMSSVSDDLGEYRIGGLPAATYVVSAYGWPPAAPPSHFVTVRGDSGSGELVDAVRRTGGFHQLFYPQSASLARAQPVMLTAGQEASGLDVALTYDAIRTAEISGRVTDPLGASTRTQIALFTDGGGIAAAANGLGTGTRPDGTFTVPADPGEYTLVAYGDGTMAMRHLSVGGEDIRDIQLVLAKTAHVSGRVVIQGSAKPTLPLALEAWSPEMLPRPLQSIAIVHNGAFSFDELLGPREFRLATALPGLTLASVTIQGRNVLDTPVDFKGGENVTDAVIVLSETAAELDGRILDADGKPASAASVVLFADDRRQLPRRAYWVRPDTTGRFVVDALASGEYFLALLDRVDDARWSTVAYLDKLRERATRISIGQGEKKSITLTWSPSP